MQIPFFLAYRKALTEYSNQKSWPICETESKMEVQKFKILQSFVAGVYLILNRAIRFLNMVAPQNLFGFCRVLFLSLYTKQNTSPIGSVISLKRLKTPTWINAWNCENRNEIFGVGFHLENTLLRHAPYIISKTRLQFSRKLVEQGNYTKCSKMLKSNSRKRKE